MERGVAASYCQDFQQNVGGGDDVSVLWEASDSLDCRVPSTLRKAFGAVHPPPRYRCSLLDWKPDGTPREGIPLLSRRIENHHYRYSSGWLLRRQGREQF
jgi:hypothetical protein